MTVQNLQSGAIDPVESDIQYILSDQASRFRESEVELIRRAYEVASLAHEGQERRSGEPYVRHCIETAHILSSLHFDSHTVTAGLLHDVIEDTGYTYEDLIKEFPQPIAELVDGVTKISSLDFRTSREQQVSNLRKMLISMTHDIRVIIIKLCDRLHNMRTLDHLPRHKQVAIARDTQDIYAPLAHRLGMDRVKTELEDLAFRYLHPQEYEAIDLFIKVTKPEREQIVQHSIEALRAYLKKCGFEVEVYGRSKHYYGIYQKMRKQNLDIEQIFDIIALRVICEEKQHCYEIVGHIHSLWPSVPGKFKDYISLPKKNGYQSIHTTVVGLDGYVTEVQIRTREMHQVNEEGIAAHWRYKEGTQERDKALENKLLWLRRLIEWVTEIEDPNEFLDSLKESVTMESIFCFTPRGDVIELPRGACPIDFAFNIHTQIGLNCTGCRINGRMMPLKTRLQNGDMVEIITSKNGHPSAAWLSLVKSGRARSKIRHWLKTQNLEEHLQKGKEALLKELKGRSSNVSWSDIADKLSAACQEMNYRSIDDLLVEIGFGNLSTQRVAERIIPTRKERRKADTRQKKHGTGVIVSDIPGAVIRFAGCCSPIHGDPIVGYITIGRGVSVHKKNCRSLRRLVSNSNSGDSRLINVKWDDAYMPRLEVSLRVVATDRKGLLNDVTAIMRDKNFQILAADSQINNDGVANLRFKIEASSRAQIDNLASALRDLESVIDIDQINAKPVKDKD